MKTQTKKNDAECCDHELDEELAGVLIAISVVSKRLAQKLTMLSQQDKKTTKGGQSDGQDE